MTDFKLSFCRFLEQHLLSAYRTPLADGQYQLQVLVAGSGQRMDDILQKILSNGQLPNTRLEVTVVTPRAESFADSFLERAPALEQIADIFVGTQQLAGPVETPLFTLRFEAVAQKPEPVAARLAQMPDYGCMFISTGSDATNLALTQAAAALPAKKRLIAYVQKKRTEPLKGARGTEVCAFGFENPREYRREVEQIALNLHYAYSKAQNTHLPVRQILQEFTQPYNYLSNLEAAVHICAKLACCGINAGAGKVAAIQFARLLERHPETLDLLAAVEHQRWMVEKMLAGYRPLQDLSRIYTNGATTHSNAEKWHCCLVPCDPSGQSRLQKADWKQAEQGIFRPDLDELDRMSLRLHVQCGQQAAANRQQIQNLLHFLRDTLTGHLCFSPQTLQTEQRMESAVAQMWQNKPSACALYQKQHALLREQIDKEGGQLASLLVQQLELLHTALAPLQEYLACKDYKFQDRLLVEQIPFALTHRCEAVVMKLLAGGVREELFSTWQLEPSQTVFAGLADSAQALWNLRSRADDIVRFLQEVNVETRLSWYILVPQRLMRLSVEQPDLFQGWDCTLCPIEESSVENCASAMEEWMAETGVDYLDVTGGDPLLVRAAEETAEAQNRGAFYVKDGGMVNLFGAEELQFPAPRKAILVREMLAASGAVLENIDSNIPEDLSGQYKALWEVASETPAWNQLSPFLFKAHSRSQLFTCKFTVAKRPKPCRPIQFRASHDAAIALLPVLHKLQDNNYITDIALQNDAAEQTTISFCSSPALETKDLKVFLEQLVQHYRPLCYYELNDAREDALFVNLRDLWVQKLDLSDPMLNAEAAEQLPDFLNRMEKAKLINSVKNDCTGISFQFASRGLIQGMKASGTALETYIYYSALLEGNFDDVERGISFFHHIGDDSAKNEIDVICTKGTSSLFISAKSIRYFADKFNYMLYEISLLSEHFGIHSKPVLVAPCFSQFVVDEGTGEKQYSMEVKRAQRRGVYFVGRECVQDNVLARVLENILEGREDWCEFVKDI